MVKGLKSGLLIPLEHTSRELRPNFTQAKQDLCSDPLIKSFFIIPILHSALVSFVQSSKDHSKNKDEVIGRLMEILEEIKALEDVTIDSLMLSPEHDLSSGARQSCRVDQDFCKDLEKISHSACSQGREEKSEDCAEEASGVCCKELDQKKPCTLDCQSGPTSRADKTNTRNTMTLQSAETVQNLLQKLNRIVGELGLDADAILPSIKQDLLHSN